MKSRNEREADPDEKIYVQGGRFVLIPNYRREHKGFFAEAQAELLAHVDELTNYKIDTLDSWVKFGMKLWDIQVGRFLGWEVYHKGQGLELYTLEDRGAIDGPDLYEVGQDVIQAVQEAFGSDAKALIKRYNQAAHFDLWTANRLTLEKAGVKQIEVSGLCTGSDTENWFSHRAEKGKTGRFGILLAINE